MRRVSKLGTDGCHDRDGTVLIRHVVLDDDRGPRFLDLMSAGGVERDKVDIASAGRRHARLSFVRFLDLADLSNVCNASSSNGNHSAAIARSRSAFSIASALRRVRRLALPSVSTSRRTARSINRLRLPFVVTRSRTATVLSGRMMLMRLLMVFVSQKADTVYTTHKECVSH